MEPHPRRRKAIAVAAFCGLIAGAVLTVTPARAAALFADNFEQPTSNVWLAGANWSVTTDSGGSKVYQQSNQTGYGIAQAGTGSAPGTVVSARLKATSTLAPSNLVSLAGRVSSLGNLYYVGLRGARLEIGQQSWGQNVVLASTPFAAATGTWYTVRLSFLAPGTVTGTAIGPDGVSATVTAADPGGPKPGQAVGFYTVGASAAFDDIALSDALPDPPPPTGPCPIRVDIKAGVKTSTVTIATFTITNVSAVAIAPPWTMTWSFPNGQWLQYVFNTVTQQRGTLVTLTSPPWYEVLQPGRTTTIPNGFNITNPIEAPAQVTFGGYTNCTVTLS